MLNFTLGKQRKNSRKLSEDVRGNGNVFCDSPKPSFHNKLEISQHVELEQSLCGFSHFSRAAVVSVLLSLTMSKLKNINHAFNGTINLCHIILLLLAQSPFPTRRIPDEEADRTTFAR